MSVITYELHMQYIHDVRFKHSCFLIIYRTSSAIFLKNLIEYDEWWSCLSCETSNKNENWFHLIEIYKSNLALHLCRQTWSEFCEWSKTAYAQYMQKVCICNINLLQKLCFAVAESTYVHFLFSLWISCLTRIWRYWTSTCAEYDEKTVAVCHDFILIDLEQSIYQFCILLI